MMLQEKVFAEEKEKPKESAIQEEVREVSFALVLSSAWGCHVLPA